MLFESNENPDQNVDANSKNKGSILSENRKSGAKAEKFVRENFDIGNREYIKKADYPAIKHNRITDGATAKYIVEIKNVKYQRLTSQIQDYIHYADQTGRKLQLFVRANNGTKLSVKLQNLVDNDIIELVDEIIL